MEFTAVNKNRKELGRIKNIKQADIEIGDTNTFELTFLIDEWKSSDELPDMDFFYCEGEEIGGFVRKIKVMTEKNNVKISGYTWRGHLDKKIIEPPAGEAHLMVSGDANEIIRQLVDGEFSGLIKGSTDVSGFHISKYQFNRYCTILEGIQAMLANVGARLQIRYVNDYIENNTVVRGYAEVSAVAIKDYSDKIEFSKDGRIHLTATDDRMGINHLICLGKGELTERTVLHLYVDQNGDVIQKQYYTGIDEICETYDYSSVESEAELLVQGTKRLNESKNSKSIEITPDDIDVDIGDIVGGKEDITGIEMKTHIIRIIYKINTNGTLTKQYKVGE